MKLLRATILLPLRLLDLIETIYLFILGLIHNSLVTVRVDFKNSQIQSLTTYVEHNGKNGKVRLVFYTPNKVCRIRAETFSSKEPHTLKWLDECGGEGTLFDIGANIGLYAIYYAKTQPGEVIAFEPSVFNLKLLTKNINANHVENKVGLITNPLSASNGMKDFRMQSVEEGGSLSAFGVNFGHDGNPLETLLSYKTLGFSLDYLFESGVLTKYPRLVKIDVDGIEHIILAGAKRTLMNPECCSVLIEVNDNFSEMERQVKTLMNDSGFKLREKTLLADDAASSFAKTFNQVWIKI